MLNQSWDIEAPQTPPRNSNRSGGQNDGGVNRHEAVNILNTPVTESRSSVKLLKTPPPTDYTREGETPKDIPMTPTFTPKKRRSHANGVSKSHTTTPKLFMAVGSVSPNITSKCNSNKCRSQKKIRPISLGLQLALAQEESSSEEETHLANNSLEFPHSGSLHNASSLTTTPKGQVISDEILERWHGKSINKDSSDSEWSDYENLMLKKEVLDLDSDSHLSCNKKVSNPFISTSLDSDSRNNIPTSSEVDYSTHAEYFNNKTGERIVRELTKEERRIKPKKLDLTYIEGENNREQHSYTQLPNNDSGNQSKSASEKFLLNNLNSFMVDSKPKRGLKFDIFKDKQN